MGKILIVKGANYSQVAVKTVNILDDGTIELTPSVLSGYSIDNNNKISSLSGWNVYYVPVTAGKRYRLRIVWENTHRFKVGISSTQPASGTTLTMLVNDPTGGGGTSLDYTYVPASDGYMAWQTLVAETTTNTITESV